MYLERQVRHAGKGAVGGQRRNDVIGGADMHIEGRDHLSQRVNRSGSSERCQPLQSAAQPAIRQLQSLLSAIRDEQRAGAENPRLPRRRKRCQIGIDDRLLKIAERGLRCLHGTWLRAG